MGWMNCDEFAVSNRVTRLTHSSAAFEVRCLTQLLRHELRAVDELGI